ncbi:hypothetical protein AK830_g11029 [Neonectria ditissima]|uniref:Uncharacterized protein n=1 Tax=Neonectria ditissima TaxID=78410 RepID=A0A0P7B5W5_9HYPO|nr:hypothetical protein AK830_g11029 [Neonectria ditissima]
MKTTSALAFLLATMAPFTASLPTSHNAVAGGPLHVRTPKLTPLFVNGTTPEDTVPVPGKPIFVPADGTILLVGRDKPSRKSFNRRGVKERQEKSSTNIAPLSRRGGGSAAPVGNETDA